MPSFHMVASPTPRSPPDIYGSLPAPAARRFRRDRPGSGSVRQLAGVLARGIRICCAARAQFCTAPIARRVEEFGQ